MSRQQETGLFAFGSSTGEIVLVDLFSNTEPIILAKVESSIDCLKWSGKNLIATSEGTLHLIDSSKNQALKSLQISAKPIRHIEISSDEKTLFMAAGSETVQVRDAVSGNIICKLASLNEMVSTIALSPDGKTLAVGTCQGNVTLWNTSDYQIRTIIPAGIN
jgi:WD40 repeat protein